MIDYTACYQVTLEAYADFEEVARDSLANTANQTSSYDSNRFSDIK